MMDSPLQLRPLNLLGFVVSISDRLFRKGWSVADYERSLELLQRVWERWEPWLAPPALIGVGSVCRRDLMHPTHGLYAILAGLEGKLPAGSLLHLFGIKGSSLEKIKMMDFVASCDSMAWDCSARRNAFKNGISNTIAHRTEHMDNWMSSATQRMQPAKGDQFRMHF